MKPLLFAIGAIVVLYLLRNFSTSAPGIQPANYQPSFVNSGGLK